MNAREEFQIGDRVRESDAYPRFRKRRSSLPTGVVVGFGFLRNPTHLRVQRDGARYATTHHMSYWEQVGCVEGGQRSPADALPSEAPKESNTSGAALLPVDPSAAVQTETLPNKET